MQNIIIEIPRFELEGKPFLDAVLNEAPEVALRMMKDPTVNLNENWGQGFVTPFATLAAYTKGEKEDPHYKPPENCWSYVPPKLPQLFLSPREDIEALLLAMIANPRIDIGCEAYEHGCSFLLVMEANQSPYQKTVLTGLTYRAASLAAPLRAEMEEAVLEAAIKVAQIPEDEAERYFLNEFSQKTHLDLLFHEGGFEAIRRRPHCIDIGETGTAQQDARLAADALGEARRQQFSLISDSLPNDFSSFLNRALKGPVEGTPYAIIKPEAFRVAAKIGREENDERIQRHAAYFLCDTALRNGFERLRILHGEVLNDKLVEEAFRTAIQTVNRKIMKRERGNFWRACPV